MIVISKHGTGVRIECGNCDLAVLAGGNVAADTVEMVTQTHPQLCDRSASIALVQDSHEANNNKGMRNAG